MKYEGTPTDPATHSVESHPHASPSRTPSRCDVYKVTTENYHRTESCHGRTSDQSEGRSTGYACFLTESPGTSNSIMNLSPTNHDTAGHFVTDEACPIMILPAGVQAATVAATAP
jgi:hypothetical protein